MIKNKAYFLVFLFINNSSHTINIKAYLQDNEVKTVIKKNRNSLAKIEQWITDEMKQQNYSGYGLPEPAKNYMNKPLGDDLTITDAMLYLSKLLKTPINYLELGVSVGKNFYQAANFFENSLLIGIDTQKPSHVLEQCFNNKKIMDEWTRNGNVQSTLTRYDYLSNTIYYLKGDVCDKSSWSRLKDKKFNLIFSDASHNKEAVLFEFEMLTKNNLLNTSEFIIVWDDLQVAGVYKGFKEIEKQLQQMMNCHLDTLIFRVRGWLGIHEPHHLVGIIMKINI